MDNAYLGSGGKKLPLSTRGRFPNTARDTCYYAAQHAHGDVCDTQRDRT